MRSGHTSLLLPLAALMLVAHLHGSANVAAVSVPDWRASPVFKVLSDLGGRGTAAEECGPQLSIETPNCTVVEKRDGYELRLYPKGQVSVAVVLLTRA